MENELFLLYENLFIKMKRVIYLLINMLSLTGFSQTSIYAVVEGNLVTLWQTGAERNCGALYRMELVTQDHIVNWFQVDTGALAYCYCHFDLSMTFGPCEPGDYTAHVFSLEKPNLDTIYQGSTSFVVNARALTDSITILEEFQSECYDFMDIEAHPKNPAGFNIFPNPFNLSTNLSVNEPIDIALELSIFNVMGNRVWNVALSPGTRQVVWQGIDEKGRYLPEGIYFAVLEGPNGKHLQTLKLIRSASIK
jgi:hypothetical protein